jgi:uncharacterized protein with PIN domain
MTMGDVPLVPHMTERPDLLEQGLCGYCRGPLEKATLKDRVNFAGDERFMEVGPALFCPGCKTYWPNAMMAQLKEEAARHTKLTLL